MTLVRPAHVVLATMLATSCASRPRRDSTPPAEPAACEITLTHTDGAGTFEGHYTYDVRGQLLAARPHVHYDATGSLAIRYGRYGTPVSVDVTHVATAATDPRQSAPSFRTTRDWFELDYDPRGRLRTLTAHGTEADGTPRLRQRARYRFDGSGRLRTVRSRSRRRRVVRLHYDAKGLATIVDRSGRRIIERDTSGRISAVSFDDGRAGRRTFDYDGQGRLSAAVHNDEGRTAEQRWTYDDAGRLLSYRNERDGRARATRFAYDAAGRWVGSSDDGGDVAVAYAGDCGAAATRPRAPTVLELIGATDCVDIWPAKPGPICDGAFAPLGRVIGR